MRLTLSVQFFFSQYIAQAPCLNMLHGFCFALRGHLSVVIALPCLVFLFLQLAAFFLYEQLMESHVIGQYYWGHWRQACTRVYST